MEGYTDEEISTYKACSRIVRPYVSRGHMGVLYYGPFIRSLRNGHIIFIPDIKNIDAFSFWFTTKNGIRIEKLAVDERLAGRGVGSSILDSIKKKYDTGDIVLRVSKKNSDAIRFYEKRGFKITRDNHVTFTMSLVRLIP